MILFFFSLEAGTSFLPSKLQLLKGRCKFSLTQKHLCVEQLVFKVRKTLVKRSCISCGATELLTVLFLPLSQPGIEGQSKKV